MEFKKYKIEPSKDEILLLIKYLKLFPGWNKIPNKYNYAILNDINTFTILKSNPVFKLDNSFEYSYDKGYWSVDYVDLAEIALFDNYLILSKSELLTKLKNKETIGNMNVPESVIKKLIRNIKKDFLYTELPTGSISLYESNIKKLKLITYTDVLGKKCKGIDEYKAIRYADLELPHISLCKIKRGETFEPLIQELEKHYGLKSNSIEKVNSKVKLPEVNRVRTNIESKKTNTTVKHEFIPFNVLEFRVTRGMSQNSLAQMLGVTRSTYQHWERDGRLPLEMYKKIMG